MSESVFPWHKAQYDEQLKQHANGRMSHALLLSGELGLGKLEFARKLAAALLCGESDITNKPCGHCESCRLISADTHPDYLEIIPEQDSEVIKIDQTRQLPEFLSLTRHVSQERVIVIYPAESMNRFSMNALLKTLEEPPENTFLLVVTHNPGMLLPTIRSRCVHIKMATPDNVQTIQWLGLDANNDTSSQLIRSIGNKPKLIKQLLEQGLADTSTQWFSQWLAIKQDKENAIKIANSWNKHEISHILFMLHGWVADLIRLKMTENAGNQPVNSQSGELKKIASKLEITQVYDYYNKIIDAMRLMSRSVNKQLLLESLLLDWQQL